MTDIRFSTFFASTADLLMGVDIDEVGDIETLLMFLFDRPIGVDEAWDDQGLASAINVIVHGNTESIESTYDFPFSVMALARSCAETVYELGPYTLDEFAQVQSSAVSRMSDDELVTHLQQALGKVRIFAMMDAED